MENRPYYEAYEERYKTVHAQKIRWGGDEPTKIVAEVMERYHIDPSKDCLELGCGEGRDAGFLLHRGCRLLATDVSQEAISYCRKLYPQFALNFDVLDCVKGQLPQQFDFIYAVAVVHMLVLDEDRSAFYHFFCDHLKPDGIGLICTMGDGQMERQTDIATAFQLQERNYCGKAISMAATSCRMVSFETFRREIAQAGLEVAEEGFTSVPESFPQLMYAVVRR